MKEDRTLGAEFLARAASQGHTDAMVEYAIAMFNGDGVEKNEHGAARLFQQAAAKGHVIAMNRLARLYAHGRGVEADPILAAAWHIAARKLGSIDPMLDDLLGGLTDRAARRSRQARADLAQFRTGRFSQPAWDRETHHPGGRPGARGLPRPASLRFPPAQPPHCLPLTPPLPLDAPCP